MPIIKRTPSMIYLTKSFKLQCSHHLTKVPEGHKCGRNHGHSYRIDICVRGLVQEDGFVIDYQVMKDIWQKLHDKYDHHNLNDFFGNPTAEHFCKYIWDEYHYGLATNVNNKRNIENQVHLHSITVRETDDSSAVYFGPPRIDV